MSDRPVPAVGSFPYSHRTLAEVDEDRRRMLLAAHQRHVRRVVVPPTERLR